MYNIFSSIKTHMRVLSMGHDDMIYLSYFENEMALPKQVVLTQNLNKFSNPCFLQHT